MIGLLGVLKSAEVEYPPDLLAARRAAFLAELEQVASAKHISLLDKIRTSLQSLFQNQITIPSMRLPKVMQTSLIVASLLVIALIASLLFRPAGGYLSPSSASQIAAILCKPGDHEPPCPQLLLNPSQDLANHGKGVAQAAVSKDASFGSAGIHQAAYANDGRSDTSWVSNSPDSWIKIDLGKVTTISSVSLQKGNLDSSQENNPGQFVIAVAQSDFYSDGNSSNDYTEYAQVFNSAQTGFNGTLSNAETIRTVFSPVKARYVKITFEKAGAAISEVGVFTVQPSVLAELPTRTPQENVSEVTSTLVPTETLMPTDSATPLPTDTQITTDTPSTVLANTLLPSPTDTLPPSNTPTPVPTDTLLPTASGTAAPLPTEPLPSDTPIPSPAVVPPTAIPPTAIPPTAQPLPATLPVSTEPIIITSSNQTLIFTCNGNDVEVRGHGNTVTLLGFCSSITVTGSDNSVFWQFGSPLITDKGNRNAISQVSP